MIGFIVFGSLAFISIVILISLSLRHSANSMTAWLGSIIMSVAAVAIITEAKGIAQEYLIALFGAGFLRYVIGFYSFNGIIELYCFSLGWKSYRTE